MTCKWIIRYGKSNTFWAYTPCKSGLSYLSRTSKVEQIKPCYEGKQCPICGKPIECNIELVTEVEPQESEKTNCKAVEIK